MKIKIESFIGMLFQIQGSESAGELWDVTKQSAIDYIIEHGGFPIIVDMPCGETLEFGTPKEIHDLPIKDIVCPCGDSKHWLVGFVSYA